MDFEHLYDFLERLSLHNSKDWMDANRNEYQLLRSQFINWLDHLNRLLSIEDNKYFDTSGKKAINRINNNLFFHPNKPIYKDHFGGGLDQKTKQGDFYIEIGLHQNLLAGGFWRPKNETLDSIRAAIDYNGEELQTILEKDSFKAMFGGLYVDDRLKTVPKGYKLSHPHIELLKNKTFAVEYKLTRDTVLSQHFEEVILKVYKEMLPFRRYLIQAATV